jgi:hypothetical protein
MFENQRAPGTSPWCRIPGRTIPKPNGKITQVVITEKSIQKRDTVFHGFHLIYHGSNPFSFHLRILESFKKITTILVAKPGSLFFGRKKKKWFH